MNEKEDQRNNLWMKEWMNKLKHTLVNELVNDIKKIEWMKEFWRSGTRYEAEKKNKNIVQRNH